MSDYTKMDILNKLKEKFPREVVKTREGPKKKVGNEWIPQKFDYIPSDHLHERLDAVVGLNWSWEVLGHTTIKFNKTIKVKTSNKDGYFYNEQEKEVEQVVVWGRLTIKDPEGNTIYRDSYGGCDISYGSQAGDSFKIADSNAFKKACYKFGIGRYLGLEGAEEDTHLEEAMLAKQSKKGTIKSNPFTTAAKTNNFEKKNNNPFTK